MPSVAIGELIGGREAGITSGSGYRLDRDGVHFARGVLGDLASVNFVSGASGRGWQLKQDGSGELNSITVNLANVRGTLKANHIDSDVRNWELIWQDNSGDVVPITVTSSRFVGPARNIKTRYDFISVLASTPNLNVGTRFGMAMIPTNQIGSSSRHATYISGINTSDQAFFNFTNITSTGFRVSGTRHATQGKAYQIWGVKSPE